MSELEKSPTSNQDGVISISLLDPSGFAAYLIAVGIKSYDFPYSNELIFHNVEYFKKCFDKNIDAHKALFLLPNDLIDRRKN